MSTPRVPLYQRLPEIYRIRDAEQRPPGQLRAYLAAVEDAFSALHENIEALYDDFFIDSCAPWVIPYLADLLGSSHLAGEVRTLRADVADTIALRRRKGTLGAIERLAADLSGWPCRAVELFPNLAWSQHLNHQRPDAGGLPPYGEAMLPAADRFTPRRGGCVPIRDPAALSLLATPFDPYAYTPDCKRADDGARHINLPNLAIWLWRLAPYRVPALRPLLKGAVALGAAPPGSDAAAFALRLDLDPLDRPLRLFNTYRRPPLDASGATQTLTAADAVPGPLPPARLNSGAADGRPQDYIGIDTFDATQAPPRGLDLGDNGLQFYLPVDPNDALDPIAGIDWRFRGDNLCAWESGLRRPLAAHEIVVDPTLGRVLIGLASAAESGALSEPDGVGGLRARLYCGYTYAAPGAVGAHPQSRAAAPTQFGDSGAGEPTLLRTVGGDSGNTLQAAFDNLDTAALPVVIEIGDSFEHPLDLAAVAGVHLADGAPALALNRSLIVRAASGQRPLIRLMQPLRLRPLDAGAGSVAGLTVRLEGLYLSRGAGFPAGAALIARAAVARLECLSCTLDAQGHSQRDGSRAPTLPSINLADGYGFADAGEADAFAPTPDVLLSHSLSGPLGIDPGYRVTLAASIVDAGRGPDEDASGDFAYSAASAPASGWGAALAIDGVTVFGRVRARAGLGSGGVFCHRLELWDNQHGCLRFCRFSGDGDRLPAHHACVSGAGARLAFTAIRVNEPGYAQLAAGSDWRIRTRGPGDDEMGAYGFLLNAHRTTNLGIRLREFMPVGVRPLLLYVT
ncbi:phage tail protein [Plasticicumulans acidivorans]|uniref:Tail protein P2 I n=1 Tax=Plasticicumulans acidivorans TaxID=886464 RepID=A0A317MV56_9GAMM|nr:phage tail protein [Plasticicumulans acidivorans]PWV61193.1 tail protein P2 I [Plasticicumulans acidivorans]